eukprot:3975804-Pleurochrysis_carterae.AAC.6
MKQTATRRLSQQRRPLNALWIAAFITIQTRKTRTNASLPRWRSDRDVEGGVPRRAAQIYFQSATEQDDQAITAAQSVMSKEYAGCKCIKCLHQHAVCSYRMPIHWFLYRSSSNRGLLCVSLFTRCSAKALS